MHDLFISYASADRQIASWLSRQTSKSWAFGLVGHRADRITRMFLEPNQRRALGEFGNHCTCHGKLPGGQLGP